MTTPDFHSGEGERGMREPDPVLLEAAPGDLVGVEVKCPRHDCDWSEPHASAEVVNEYGVKDPIPDRCEACGLPVKVEKIVTVVRCVTPPKEQTVTQRSGS